MKVILTCETGLPLLSVFGKMELVSLSQLPRLLRLGVATEVEFLRELFAIAPQRWLWLPLLTQLTCRCLLASTVDQACVTSLALHLPHTPRARSFLSAMEGSLSKREYRSQHPGSRCASPRFENGPRREAVDLRTIWALTSSEIVRVFHGCSADKHISRKLSPAAATFLLTRSQHRWSKFLQTFLQLTTKLNPI